MSSRIALMFFLILIGIKTVDSFFDLFCKTLANKYNYMKNELFGKKGILEKIELI